MAFADPQTITINSIAKTLARTGSGLDTGSFSKDDGEVKMRITHTYGKRQRRHLRVDHQKLAADVMDSSVNKLYAMGVSLTVDVPLAGYTIAEQKQVVDALVAYLTASSGARVTQLLGGES